MKPGRYKVVAVTWIDPASPLGAGWAAADAVATANPVTVRSVGWLVQDRKEQIAVATCYIDEANGDIGGITVIPRVCVQSLETLVPKGRR